MIWLSFTSGAPSLRLAVLCLPPLTYSSLIYPGVFCCTTLQRGSETHAGLFSLYAFCFCQHFQQELAHYESLLQTFCVVRLVLSVCLLSVHIHVYRCTHKHNRSWCIPFYTNPEVLISPGLLWSSSASLISEEPAIPLCL